MYIKSVLTREDTLPWRDVCTLPNYRQYVRISNLLPFPVYFASFLYLPIPYGGDGVAYTVRLDLTSVKLTSVTKQTTIYSNLLGAMHFILSIILSIECYKPQVKNFKDFTSSRKCNGLAAR